jgi:hypothetical protein
MERREFIKHGSIATAGLALLPTSGLFAANKDKVRLGFIGVGLRGRDHVNHCQKNIPAAWMPINDSSKGKISMP